MPMVSRLGMVIDRISLIAAQTRQAGKAREKRMGISTGFLLRNGNRAFVR